MLKRTQLAGANYSYTRHTLTYFINSMVRLGIDQIEMYAASPHMYVYDYNRAAVKQIKKRLDTAKIKVVCLTAEQCMIPVSISINDALVRKRSFDYYMRALEQASELESPYMHMIAGNVFLESNPQDDLKRAIEGISKVATRASFLGIKIALEADRSSPIKNTSDIRMVIDTIGRDCVRGLLDTNAVYHAHENFDTVVTLLNDDLAHIHFIDIGEQGGCLVPGEGNLPMADYLSILSRHDYKGYLVPELWGWRYLNEAENAIQRSRDFCYLYMQ